MKAAAVPADARGNVGGAVAMMLGMAGFVTNDMFVKLASETLPTGETIFLRGVLTTLIVLALVVATGAHAQLRELGRGAVGVRTLGEVFSTVLYLTALFHIPIADATAILQAMPIIMTLAAALFLREIVRWRRWLAIILGFIGMLMIVQPGGEGFTLYSLFAVAALAFVALRDLATRYIPLSVPGLLVAAAASVAVTIAGALMGLGETWVMPTPVAAAWLAGAAICLTCGYFFLIKAMRSGEMSFVSPFRYTILLWAVLYGFLIWGELPNALAVAGIVLIVTSGLYVFYRENALKRSIEPATISVPAPR